VEMSLVMLFMWLKDTLQLQHSLERYVCVRVVSFHRVVDVVIVFVLFKYNNLCVGGSVNSNKKFK